MVQIGMIDIVAVEGDEANALSADVDGILDRTAEELGHPFGAHPLHLKIAGADGTVMGGLVGARLQGWFYVKLLAVAPAARGAGLGGRLLRRAEEIALNEGLAGVYLDTFGFQAPRFYLQQGYHEIGRLPAVHGQPERIWFAKTFANNQE